MLHNSEFNPQKNNSSQLQQESFLYVHDFFHQQAQRYPDKTAVVFHHSDRECDEVSYQDVDSLSTQLANHLRKTIAPQTFIGISLERSINLIIAILAILKAECVVVPLENAAETIQNELINEKKLTLAETIKKKLAAASLKFILCDNQTEFFFQDKNVTAINLTHPTTLTTIKSQKKTINFENSLSKSSLSYLEFTSGSTGEPKIVMMTHEGFANQIPGQIAQNHEPESKVICTSLPTFDAFLFDLIVSMVTHGQFHFTTEEYRYSPIFLAEIIRKYKITTGVFIVDLFNKLDPNLALILKYVICMGSAPNEKTLTKWKEINPACRVHNALGHTESGIALCFYPYTPGSNPLLIGTPIPNMDITILDEKLSPCGPNMRGEMYISGPGVAAGYLNNGEKTKERFLDMFFDPVKNAYEICSENKQIDNLVVIKRFYKSGDYGCYHLTSDNQKIFEFMGREDRQVKIHGNRVDIEKIEGMLRKLDGIKDIILIPHMKNNQNTVTSLQAYVIPQNIESLNNSFTTNALKTELKEKMNSHLQENHIPNLAWPKTLVLMAEFPITANGKVDTKRLPHPAFESSAVKQSTIKDELIIIFQKALDCPSKEIAADKKLSELGADSTTLANIEAKLKQKYNFSLNSFKALEKESINSLEQKILKKNTASKIHNKIENLKKQKKEPQQNSFTITKFPSEILLKINKNLPSWRDTASFACVNWQFNSLFKPEIGKKEAKDAAEFAIFPIDKFITDLKRLLKTYPALLLHPVKVENRFRRTIKGTVYQIALYEGDNELINDIIIKAFEKLPDGKKIMATQHEAWLSEGWIKKEENACANTLKAIDDVFTALKEASHPGDVVMSEIRFSLHWTPKAIINHSGLKKALEVFRKAIHTLYQETDKIIESGRDPSIRILERVIDRYKENCNEHFRLPHNEALAQAVYSYCQMMAPINFRQAFKKGVFNYIFHNKEKLDRSYGDGNWPRYYDLTLPDSTKRWELEDHMNFLPLTPLNQELYFHKIFYDLKKASYLTTPLFECTYSSLLNAPYKKAI